MTSRRLVESLAIAWLSLGCRPEEEVAVPPTALSSAAVTVVSVVAPQATVEVRQAAVDTAPASVASQQVAPADPPSERLSEIYPDARSLHRWQGRHAHSAEFASADSYAKVKAYYLRYAKQNPGYKVSEDPGGLDLDGGAAMGLIRVRTAPTSPPDARLKPGEVTLISSSRP